MLRVLALFLLVSSVLAPARAAAEYIRDQVRVNLRSGPDTRFGILRVVSSGEKLEHVLEDDGWVQVRTQDGTSGWVPAHFVTDHVPAVVTLPQVKARLALAEQTLAALRLQLGSQNEGIQELQTLRERNTYLEKQNRDLVWGDTWKKWLAGAAIAGSFLVFGALWPTRSNARSRKIRL